MHTDQHEFDIKCEWGLNGIEVLALYTDVFVIVDVLSFSSAVDVAVSRGAVIYPFNPNTDAIDAFAESVGAVVASPTHSSEFSLSTGTLVNIPSSTRLILPSLNGAVLSLATGSVPTFAGCLRNAQAVAQAAQQIGQRIAVIPAGERWTTDSTLCPSLEDWIGAGSIIEHLRGSRSPEAWAAATLFRDARRKGLTGLLRSASSGKELIAADRLADVDRAAEYNVSMCAPRLIDGAYQMPAASQSDQ